MTRYKGDMDDRMWGANRVIGRILGGMPLKVAHEFFKHFVPDYGVTCTVRTMTNIFSTRRQATITLTLRFTGTGELQNLDIPRADAQHWLEEHYPNGYRMGRARKG